MDLNMLLIIFSYSRLRDLVSYRVISKKWKKLIDDNYNNRNITLEENTRIVSFRKDNIRCRVPIFFGGENYPYLVCCKMHSEKSILEMQELIINLDGRFSGCWFVDSDMRFENFDSLMEITKTIDCYTETISIDDDSFEISPAEIINSSFIIDVKKNEISILEVLTKILKLVRRDIRKGVRYNNCFEE